MNETVETIERTVRPACSAVGYTKPTMLPLNSASSGVPRMVGREAQLATLEAHLTAAVSGHGRIVFVAGDAGIGKTRLIRELLARHAGEVELLEGRCYIEDPPVPYGPVADALRAELRRIGRDAFVERAGPWLRDLGTLLPELETDERDGTLPVDAQFGKRRLFEALRHMLQLSAGAAARIVLLQRLGHAAYPLGDVALVAKYWAEALLLSEQLGDRLLVGDLHRWLGRAEWERGNKGAAFEHLRAALAELEQAPPGYNLAMAYSGMSQLCMLTSDHHQSISWAEKALALAEQLGASDVSSHALNNIGCSLVELGEAERGIAALERSLELARTADARMEVVRAYHNLGGNLSRVGQLQRAAAVLHEGVTYAEQVGWSSSPTGVSCFSQLANIEQLLGNYAAAHAVLDRAEVLAELPSGNGPFLAFVRANLFLLQGRIAEARAALERVPEHTMTSKQHKLTGLRLGVSVKLALAAGEQQEASALFDRYLEHWQATGEPGDCLAVLPWTLDLLLALDRTADARRLISTLQPTVAASPDPADRALLATASGILAAQDGRTDEAAALLGQAAALFEQLPCPYESAVARRRRAETLLHGGGNAARDEAQRELATARAAFGRLGAALQLETTDAVARRFGLLRRITRPQEPRDALTPRERQVLSVLARGLSNRAIAEQLVISEKTVEVHVSNILGKLQVQSRVQAATYAVDQGLIAPPGGH